MYKCCTLLDTVVVCPYNKNHFISRSRIQKHIVKCEKQYPEKLMCPYNATHRLLETEFEEHIITCPDRNVCELETYSETRKHGATNFGPSDISSIIDSTENWDLETDDDSFAEGKSPVYSNVELKAHCVSQHILKEKSKDVMSVRAPRGFSEAMLREASEDSCVDDLESVVSSMGIGRGKVTSNINKLRKIGIGRGKPMNIL
ncbi:Gametocyte-specific factor 1 [Melipona quadrifasciata]|uniref:Gametocyte-specific factor 1 n=1 Tax=Melipona quadrifasciata TaxID=166423 RepID=A0A0M9A7V3_9HYME|nr:Gametocyte-specific factor 1 [Melipona quadrifasciata]